MRPAPRAPARLTEPEERGAGWLSDLLARASREEAEGEVGDMLDDLLRNIARFLDQDSAVSLWDRYYRGDANVFTRNIYTPAGQKAFDEVRRRYRGEPDFRAAVTGFVQNFEARLQKMGRDDRDGTVVRGQLVSDAGKAYTMLSHAAERFDGL